MLQEKFNVKGIAIRSTIYIADFVVYDNLGNIAHVYDVKNSFSNYAIDAKAQLKFKLFAQRYNVPVEVVVILKNSFKVKILGVTKHFEPVQLNNVNYDLEEILKNRYYN